MRAGFVFILILTFVGCRERATPQAATSAPSTSKQVSAVNIEKTLAAVQEYITSNDLPKAQAILLTLIDRAPNEVRGHELLGQLYAMQAEAAEKQNEDVIARMLYEKGYEQYTIVTGIDPQSAGLQHSAGVMAIVAKQPAAALKHFQNAGRLDPKNPQFPLFEAQMLIQDKHFDEAITALQRVLAIDPDEPIAHASLAMVAVEQNRFDDAVRFITEARRIRPDDVGLRAQEAKVWRRKGEPRKALELLIGMSPTDRAREVVATEIAAAYDAMGEQLKVAATWENCIKVDPNNARAWLWQVKAGEALLKAGQREQADQWLQRAKMTNPAAKEVQALDAAIKSGK